MNKRGPEIVKLPDIASHPSTSRVIIRQEDRRMAGDRLHDWRHFVVVRKERLDRRKEVKKAFRAILSLAASRKPPQPLTYPFGKTLLWRIKYNLCLRDELRTLGR